MTASSLINIPKKIMMMMIGDESMDDDVDFEVEENYCCFYDDY